MTAWRLAIVKLSNDLSLNPSSYVLMSEYPKTAALLFKHLLVRPPALSTSRMNLCFIT